MTLEKLDAIDRLEPQGVDADAGWVCYVVLPDGHAFLQFDFRRNRARVQGLLSLAREYLNLAALGLEQGLLRPCLEACHAAAELAVSAMMFLEDDRATSGARLHNRRLNWLDDFTEHGNAPRDLHSTLVELAELHPAARYGDETLSVSEDQTRNLYENVEGLVVHAEGRVSPPNQG